ncbi:MAG: SDR family oxidoreductase [Coxiellaceae bacterium]|nr:SDR family oxidoreductase [Coxiellaceae bacterium]
MLNNKIILITGATSGIGEACAHLFAAQGAKLLLCARRTNLLTSLTKKLRDAFHVDIHTVSLDVRDREQVKQQLSTLPTEWKSIDILLNNAGLAAGLESMNEANIDDWEAMIDTNVKGLLFVTRALLPQMVEKKSGHIINIGSISGHQVYPRGGVYCATKFAVKALSQGLRMDLLGTNIRVTTISPGAVETNFSNVRFKGDTAKAVAVYEGWTPLQAEDIADTVLFAATRKPHVNIDEILVMPTAQAAAGMIVKQTTDHSTH